LQRAHDAELLGCDQPTVHHAFEHRKERHYLFLDVDDLDDDGQVAGKEAVIPMDRTGSTVTEQARATW
jgi:hypothetical protein